MLSNALCMEMKLLVFRKSQKTQTSVGKLLITMTAATNLSHTLCCTTY